MAQEPIKLTTKQREILTLLSQDTQMTKLFRRRARILLTSEQIANKHQIAYQFNVTLRTIITWQKRWKSCVGKLNEAEEQGASDTRLRQMIIHTLKHTGRRYRQSKVNQEQTEQIVALWREDSIKYGYRTWTMKALAQVAMDIGIVDYVSPVKVALIMREARQKMIQKSLEGQTIAGER